MSRPFTVVAIIAAHNEADIIESVVRDLIAQGVDVYYIDDDSTDGTREIVEQYAGRGVIGMERFEGAPGNFEWERILQRKEALASTLDADWFIHHDADEFRESPWAGVSLKEAIGHVDIRGFTAVDFTRYDFWPTPDDSTAPGDVRCRLTHWAEPAPYDRLQLRCWKRGPDRVDLASSGGHQVSFHGLTVFPIPFVLRHYPVRDFAQGERKLRERRGRFTAAERERGWHVQYDHIADTSDLFRARSDLRPFDPNAIRIDHHLAARANVVQLEVAVTALNNDVRDLRHQVSALSESVEARGVALQHSEAIREELRTAHDEIAERLTAANALNAARADQLQAEQVESARLRQALSDVERHRNELLSSLSWRVTGPARGVSRFLRGR